MKRKFNQLRLPLAMFVFLLFLWVGAVRFFNVPSYELPDLFAVLTVGVQRSGDLIASTLITVGEALGAFVLSVIIGISIGLFFAVSPLIRRIFYPYVIVLQTVPIIAISPLILLWLGNGSSSVLFIALIICLPPIIANTTQGLISVDKNLIDLFRMGNASVPTLLFKLRLPAALPNIFVGLRIAAGLSVVGALVGENFAGSSAVGRGGLGYSSIYALSELDTSYLFALVLVSTLLGFGFFLIVTFWEWFFLHNWHESLISEGSTT
jgi:NitT/TauT family transport system permease protein